MGFPPLPDKSSLISETKTYVYKHVGGVSISIDVILPTHESLQGRHVPLMLFLHGGAWIGGDRTEQCRPLVHEFLKVGFIVASADYRLLPETPFVEGQLEDIRDLEAWLRKSLPVELRSYNIDIDTETIVVVGSSAGALLALLTPKLWAKSPTALLSIYGPTNLHNLPFIPKGPFTNTALPELTSKFLVDAMTYHQPPSSTPPPTSMEDFMTPRRVIGLTMFRKAVVPEFLLRGLVKSPAAEDEPAKLSLPAKGSVGKEEIDEINPIHLCTLHKYPPTFLVIGTEDELFDVSHVHDFAQALQSTGTKVASILVPDKGHAFDIFAAIGGDIHASVFEPAVSWISAKLPSQKKTLV